MFEKIKQNKEIILSALAVTTILIVARVCTTKGISKGRAFQFGYDEAVHHFEHIAREAKVLDTIIEYQKTTIK